MTDRFDELARAWGEDGCTLWRRESCDRFPNGCPECPAQFADGVAALLRRVDTEAEERGLRAGIEAAWDALGAAGWSTGHADTMQTLLDEVISKQKFD